MVTDRDDRAVLPRPGNGLPRRHALQDRRLHRLPLQDRGLRPDLADLATGFQAGEISRVIREDPVRPGLLYVGTETGITVSWDDGRTWHRCPWNLPVTPVYDLAIKGSDLVAATHGRSFWVLDDLTPLRELSAEATGGGVHLFPPRSTVRPWQNWSVGSLPRSGQVPQELHDGARDRADVLRGPDARRGTRAHVPRRR